jgi:hypothetical protein
MEVGRWKMGDGRWKMEVGNGRWKMGKGFVFFIVFCH